MDNEPEDVIKHQMLETRQSLAEKLETLEQQVVGTVQTATTAVTDTVETVKEAVQQTVETAKASVRETVEAVKETFDVAEQVRKHPWIMVGGSAALGYAAGYFLHRTESARIRGYPVGVPSLSTLGPRPEAERNGGVGASKPQEAFSAQAGSTSAAEGFIGGMAEKFKGEIHKLKGLALGTLLSAVRDMVARSAPPQFASELAEIIDSATVKLGGQPIQGSVLDMFRGSPGGQGGFAQSRAYAEGGPGPAYGQTRHAEGTVD
jgi:ElaB/YqjD/DUF883 family membrane-anchored ribosome-binding protein